MVRRTGWTVTHRHIENGNLDLPAPHLNALYYHRLDILLMRLAIQDIMPSANIL